MIVVDEKKTRFEGKTIDLCTEMEDALIVFRKMLCDDLGETEGMKIFNRCIELSKMSEEERENEMKKAKQETMNDLKKIIREMFDLR